MLAYYTRAHARRFMRLPSNVIMLSADEFSAQARDAPDITYDRGTLTRAQRTRAHMHACAHARTHACTRTDHTLIE